MGGKSAKYYEELNYKIPKRKDKYGNIRVKHGTTILVKIEDLQKVAKLMWKYCVTIVIKIFQ